MTYLFALLNIFFSNIYPLLLVQFYFLIGYRCNIFYYHIIVNNLIRIVKIVRSVLLCINDINDM